MRIGNSVYLKPISIISHLIILNVIFYYLLPNKPIFSYQTLYLSISWLIIAYFISFYNVYRLTKFQQIATKFLYQFVIFTLAYFSYYGFFDIINDLSYNLIIIGLTFVSIALFRIFFMLSLKKYRLKGGNYRNVVVIGNNSSIKKMTSFFNTRQEFGYRYIGYFSDKNQTDKKYLGNVQDAFSYILKEELGHDDCIHEIYCSIAELTQEKIKDFIDFADNNLKTLKFIPDSKEIFRKGMSIEYYDYLPVLHLRKSHLERPLNYLLKRIFDIFFSLLVIIFVFSWLVPILYVFVKLDSKGPLFFSQLRDGIDGGKFYCFKFRSMAQNDLSDKIQATRNDQRVTKVGRFIRKTSIDELPQFFNVFLGDMSVVGPRPHMLSQTEKFRNIVDKYMVRHFVKPGITGLAQVKGYRGEVEKNSDMENRIRYDIFYIENWSFFLDIKIVIQTVTNAIRGEDKAY